MRDELVKHVFARGAIDAEESRGLAQREAEARQLEKLRTNAADELIDSWRRSRVDGC